MKKIFLILFSLCFISNVYSQEKYTISGYVQDLSSGESLIGVSIYDKKDYKGTTSNQYGFYSLTIEEGTYDIIYSFIGYKSIVKTINLNKDVRYNISLQSDAILTDEVIVTGERLDKNVSSSNMSQAKLEVENIK